MSGPMGAPISGPPGITTVRKKSPPKGFQPEPIAGREARCTTWALIFGGYFADLAPKGEELLEWCAAEPMEITKSKSILSSTDVPR